VPEATAADYLKTLAISRLYLDNIDHIQSSWLTPGIKICQIGLQFGADDVGSILIEENVVFAAGVRNRTNEGELRRIIADAGYTPVQRDTLYRCYYLKHENGDSACRPTAATPNSTTAYSAVAPA
jgi:cyclic dehypoxanthinyl futalosine synthase